MEKKPDLPEEALLERAMAGDKEAFYSLYLRQEKGLYSLCYHLLGNRTETEDAVQDVVLKAYSHIRDYRFREGIPFSAWLYRIATNTCLSLLRRRRGSVVSGAAQEIREEADPQPGPAEQLLREDERARIRQAVAALPEVYRLPIVLRYVQEMSYQAIAHVLELPVNTVATRLRRAHSLLREELERGSGQTGPPLPAVPPAPSRRTAKWGQSQAPATDIRGVGLPEKRPQQAPPEIAVLKLASSPGSKVLKPLTGKEGGRK
ncbi:MAG: RNA polymerase sigma factor [Firmicutes bacterium]|nr:RNA polymerase sigma factor [Bacillota bacterium]MCL5038635.1 RNA polymerase sigma factor [Bacillota bacterium]